MSTPNQYPSTPERIFSPKLKDTIFEFLPLQARQAFGGGKVVYWPLGFDEMEMTLTYSPNDNQVSIDTKEGVYPEAGCLTGWYIRGCDLDTQTGEVIVYEERIEPLDDVDKPIVTLNLETASLENLAIRFDAEKELFFLNRFESI